MARILVVDDEPLISAMTEEWLSELGHVVVGPAHNLATALKLAEMDMDAAIVDVSLGKDNAYPLADALSARGVPFALATGYGQDAIDPRYRAHSTLMKPFEFASFRRLVDQLLAESGMQASP
ncbi:MAG TPA: response regulator [Roseiarcus sp.]|nr:response regulator [Roseiarcus sp.]